MQVATPPVKRQEVVIMVGVPGSGKTTYARERLSGHVHVSLDVNNLVLTGADKDTLLDRYEREEPLNLGQQPHGMPPNPAGREYRSSLSREQGSRNRKREYVQMADALRSGGDVVIDDTNLTSTIRWPYVLMARQYGASVTAVYFTNVALALERNRARTGRARVPDHVLRRQCGALEMPRMEEGFDCTRWAGG